MLPNCCHFFFQLSNQAKRNEEKKGCRQFMTKKKATVGHHITISRNPSTKSLIVQSLSHSVDGRTLQQAIFGHFGGCKHFAHAAV